MPQVISFEDYRPVARYDSEPWTEARVEEATLVAGPWVLIDTIALSPLDADPSDPAVRNLTTQLADDAPDLWYRIIFADADGDTSLPTTPVQNTSEASAYATVDELFRILKIRNPSAEQTVAGNRILLAAAGEINAEVDLADDDDPLSGWELSLAAEVNLERAVEHWRQQEAPFGLLTIEGALGPAERTARDSWERHANKLAPLKAQWGLAALALSVLVLVSA